MARLPKVGGDDGSWGQILNDFLAQSHNDDGSLRVDTVGAPQLQPNSIKVAAIGDGQVTQSKLADGSVGASQIADGAVDEDHLTAELRERLNAGLEDGSISETKLDTALRDKVNAGIPDGAVTTNKLATGSVGTAQLADGSVSRSKLSEIGMANGIASLGSDARLPDAQLPSRLAEEQLSATIGAGAEAVVSLSLLTPPVGFALPNVAVQVYRTALGLYAASIDIDALRPAAGVTYYVAPAGISGNNGLSEASPTTLAAAIAKSDVGTIVCLPGEYFRNSHTAPVLTKSLNIIGRPGAILTGYELTTSLTWTVQSGNIYQATRANTNLVVDKRSAYATADGDFTMYEKKADLASVTGPGQWAIVGSVVYVWALGNANLATDSSFMRLSLATGSSVLQISGGNTLYLEGVQLEGGGSATSGPLTAFSAGGTGGVPRLIAVDSVVKYAPANGIMLTGALFGIFIRCGVAVTMNDGFNYHSGTFSGQTYIPSVLEVDCWSRRTGMYTTVETQNGTTAHDGVPILRINGTHRDSLGPAVADDSGAKSWNLNVIAGAASRAVTRFWAFAATAAGSEQWLQDCAVAPGNVALYADGTSKVHTRRARTGSVLTASKKVLDAAVIDTY